jgi:hypothetical protein
MESNESEVKQLIGRRDLIDLPDYSLFNISAKIDTGAYTSALHAFEIRKVGDKLFFKVEHSKGQIEIEAKEFSERLIKNSSGATEKRFVVKTRVLIFNKIIETEFSLCDRSEMKHPVLLGRKFLKDQFIVDVSRFNLSYKQKRKLERKNLA